MEAAMKFRTIAIVLVFVAFIALTISTAYRAEQERVARVHQVCEVLDKVKKAVADGQTITRAEPLKPPASAPSYIQQILTVVNARSTKVSTVILRDLGDARCHY